MKRSITITLASLVILGLSACSVPKPVHVIDEPTPAAIETPAAVTPDPVVVEPEPAPAVSSEEVFNAMMTSEFGPGMAESAKQVATSFCDLIDSVSGDYELAVKLELGIAETNGVTPEQLGKVLGAGVPAFCPEYADDQIAFVAAHQ